MGKVIFFQSFLLLRIQDDKLNKTMKIITRATAIKNLKKYIGQDLRKLAMEHRITTYETGKQNKGWKGHILEILAGLQTSSSKQPNGITFELKSVSFRYVKGILVPKETMAITMVNPNELKDHDFFNSHCWDKLKAIIFCAVHWHGQNVPRAELLKVFNFDLDAKDNIVLEIKQDYDLIRNKLIEHGFEALTGKDGKWIQARTKGAGHGSTSRAFYARTGLVKVIFDSAK